MNSQISAPMDTPKDAHIERRAWVRREILLAAMLTGRWAQPIGCTIRDFCKGGMYISLLGRPPGHIKTGPNVAIHFALVVDGEHRQFEVDAKVMRTLDSGIGVAFVRIDEGAIAMLERLADASSPDDEKPKDSRYDPATVDKILAEIRRQAEQQLSGVIGTFFQGAENALFIAARDAQNNVQEVAYFDARSALKNSQAEVISRIAKNLSTLLDSWRHKGDGGKTATKAGELSLVDDTEFEEFLAVTDAVARLEPRYKEQIYALERRLSTLTGEDYGPGRNPLEPAAICRVYFEAVHRVAMDRDSQTLCYKKLEAALDPALANIYDAANELFVREGIVPQIEYRPQVIMQSDRYDMRSQKDRKSGGGGPGGGGSGLTAAGGDVGEQTVAAPEHGLAHENNVGAPTANGIPGGPSVTDTEPRQPTVVAAATGGGAAAGVTPVSHHELLTNLGLRATAAVPRRTFQEAFSSAKNVISLGRRLKSLSGIEQEDTIGPIADDMPGVAADILLDAVNKLDTKAIESLDYRNVRAALLTNVQRATGETEVAIGSEQNDVLEIVSAMFRALAEDGHIADDIRPLFKRLQRAVFKIALADNSFFEDEQHPATRFLNRLGELHTATPVVDVVEDTPDPWFIESRLDDLLDSVSTAQNPVQAFADALPQLELLAARQDEKYRQHIERIIATCEEQQAFLKSRRRKEEQHEHRPEKSPGGEWELWLDRTKRLQIGDHLLFSATQGQVSKAAYVWAGEHHDPLVFADNKGNKAATLTLQEVAMQLRRGVARIIENDGMSVVQRALSKILYTLHDRVKHHAFRDSDTGLMSRKRFVAQIEQAKAEQKNENRTDILCHIGVDRYAVFAKAYGHDGGVALITETANRVKQHLGARGDVARIAESEIGVLLYGCGAEEAHKLLEHQMLVINHTPFQWDKHRIEITVSIAALTLNGPSHSADKLLKVTKDVLEELQKKGGNNFHLLEPKVPSLDTTTGDLSNEDSAYLDKLLEENSLTLGHELVFATGENDVHAILYDLSLLDPNDTAIKHGELLTRADRIGKRVEFDQRLLDLAFQWMQNNLDTLDSIDAVVVPVSGGLLKDRDLANKVIERLMDSEVPPFKICFEVTEGTALERLADVQDFVHTLKEFGCRFCIREFGGAEGSYSYLDELPVDFVKVANLFIDDISDSESDRTMVQSIAEIAHFTGKQTIACNIKKRSSLAALRTANIDLVKGPGFHPCTPLAINP
jgi:diguanylate cyclase (GGDEF)-like protein